MKSFIDFVNLYGEEPWERENKYMKKFTGYQKGNLNNEITYKCWFVITDANGFTAKEVKYLSVEEFKSLPKVGKEVK